MVVLFSRVFVGDKSVYSRLQKILGLGSVTAKRFCALLGCNVKTGLKESGRILFRLE